jgi:hypothetical protein
MKPLIACCLLLLAFTVNHAPAGNAYYDFPETIIAHNQQNITNGTLSQLLSICGYYRESMQYEDSAGAVKLSLTNYKITAAKPVIIKEAGKYRFLLINEAHNRPQHRLFTKSLLKELYAKGYRVFMAEGIWQGNTLAAKGYPVSTDGRLINEPNYASLLRYARKLGYKIYAYEYDSKKQTWDDSIKLDQYGSMKYLSYDPKDSMSVMRNEKGEITLHQFTSVREEQQAANIVKVMKENPGARFVIHVGYAHLQECCSMMTNQLKILLNQEEVLTINQTNLDERRTILDTATGNIVSRPFFYLLKYNDQYKFYRNAEGGAVDLNVFNAQLKDSLNRPGYLWMDVEKRSPYYIPASQLKDGPCLYSAYDAAEYTAEGSNTIAKDVVLVKDINAAPPLLLYKGSYTIVRKMRDGRYSSFTANIP